MLRSARGSASKAKAAGSVALTPTIPFEKKNISRGFERCHAFAVTRSVWSAGSSSRFVLGCSGAPLKRNQASALQTLRVVTGGYFSCKVIVTSTD